MKIYEVTVHLYEGEDVEEGLWASKEAATAHKAEIKEDWEGPNVLGISVREREVRE